MNDEDMRTYLDVPFEEKDEAKSIGARWDPGERRWFIPTYVPPDDFENMGIGFLRIYGMRLRYARKKKILFFGATCFFRIFINGPLIGN